MKKIKALIETLNAREFEDKYPNYDLEDGKVHVLYISPCLNGTGYYRAIAPALELNNTDSHSAIISSIHKWNFNKQFDDYDSPIDEELIRWANYIVLPALFTDATYIINILQKIKEDSQSEDDLQFVMDLDMNYHKLPKTHPNHSKITKEMKVQLLDNISKMDILTSPSEDMLDYYEVLIEKAHPKTTVFLEHLPNLVSEYGYTEVKPLKRNEGHTVKIGLIGNASTAFDSMSILNVLKKVKKKHPNNVEIVFFGWDGKLNGESKLDGLEFTTVKSISFLDYFNVLNELGLDIALLPLANLPFNTHGRSSIKYYELAVFGIPVVASDLEPYSLDIKHLETGLLANGEEQWLSGIDTLISNKVLRKHIGKSALKAVWRNHAFTSANLQAYQELFI